MTPHTYKDLSEFVQTSPATVFTETRQLNFSLIGLGIVTSPIRDSQSLWHHSEPFQAKTEENAKIKKNER